MEVWISTDKGCVSRGLLEDRLNGTELDQMVICSLVTMLFPGACISDHVKCVLSSRYENS